MRTIFFTVDPAFPPVSGADLRSWQNAFVASRLGPVLLVSLAAPGRDQPPNGINSVALSAMDSSVFRAPKDGTDIDVGFPPDAIDRLHGLAKSFKPDAIVLESLPMHPLVAPAKQCAKQVIIDLHNVESHLTSQEAPRPRWRHLRTNLQVERRAKRISAIEKRVSGLADCAWVCSTLERDRLRKIAPSDTCIHVVPNGIPRVHLVPTELQRRQMSMDFGPTLVFFGHLSYAPNIDAALSLADMMPALWCRLPQARLLLAGRDPHPDILMRAQPGKIDVIPNPTRVDAILQRSDIAVLPIRRGGGTRIKALEAMAWGLPVVATARAVEGLGLENGVHVQLAESAEEFVSRITALTQNREAFEAQQIEAQRYVRLNYGQDMIMAAVHAGLGAE